ncbi:rhamnogalacturonan lyase [Clostridium estertheticum]|nr:rhamnogalacturonan lyase [Clostridium estertheticum]
MENINRGINAVKAANGVLVSWRLLGTEAQDLEFDVYRDNVKINSKPIKSSTNYLDAKGTTTSKYYVRTIGGKSKESKSETVTAWENNYKELPIRKPAAGINKAGEIYDYTANDASVADLDGDGKYEIVLNWAPTNAKDNSQAGYTGNTYIDAYKLDGTFMWRIDLGKNIRSGAHYTDIMVYDFDGDGKAELTTRTADGTIDGEGNIIGDEDKDYSNAKGYILDGPEYHTMFEGATGKALDTQAYEPQRGAFATDINEWGDTYGNRGDRFIASVAYLDGKTPSVVMQRGYYTRMAIVAYGFKNGKFVKQWTFDSQFDEVDPNGLKYTEYRGQGNHNVSVGDVDADGMDEIITGAAVINQDGKALYTTKLGHGDAMHFGDLDPTNPGLEIYQVQEEKGSPYGMDIRDAGTGKILFGVKSGIDTGRGLSADIDPNYIGEEIWAIDGAWNSSTGGLYTVKGEKISEGIPSSNFAIWWDGDLQRELLDHNWNGYGGPASPGTISKWDYVNKKSVNILTATGTNSNNGTKGNPCLQADLFGDWREEVIWRTEDSSALRIYATSDVTETKLPTLMHDPIYRLGVAFQNTGYNQPPHTSYYLGSGMTTPPQPNITMARGGTEVKIK